MAQIDDSNKKPVPFPIVWRLAFASERGPKNPTTRHVLHVLSTWMNDAGFCYPTVADIAVRSALNERIVRKHLGIAVAEGWIKRWHRGKAEGQKWKNYQYQAAIPEAKGPDLEADPLREAPDSKAAPSAKDRTLDAEGPDSECKRTGSKVRLTLKELLSNSPEECSFSDEAISVEMWNKILLLNPTHKPPKLDDWADTIRLMRESDSRTPDEIRELFAWANNHKFWKTNILSPGKLRKQWDRLMTEKLNDHKRGSANERFADRRYEGTADADLPEWAR